GLLPRRRVVLRHVPPRARGASPRRGLYEPLVRAQRRAARRRRVRVGARSARRRDDARRRDHVPHGRVPRRLRLRDRRRRRQPIPARRAALARGGDRGRAPVVTGRSMLLEGTDERDLTKLDEYVAIGGYAQLPKARAMTSDELIAELQAANLRGRGGAGV